MHGEYLIGSLGDKMREDVNPLSPIEPERLRIGKPKLIAAGITGVAKSFRIGISEAGIGRTLRTMRTVNRFDGYDCPGCAWPDPDNHRSGFEPARADPPGVHPAHAP